MEISRKDAADALRDVERAQAHAGEMRGYRHIGPYLIGWGLIWAIGYVLMAVRPQSEWGMIWLLLDAAAIIASLVWARVDRARRPVSGVRSRMSSGLVRFAAAILFVILFVAGTYTVFRPVTVAPLAVFPGMMAGAVYMAIGLAWMPRLAWIGFAIFVLSVAAYLFAGPSLLYWMAATGGGGLIVSGLWLRAA